jgi:hypothetical protein
MSGWKFKQNEGLTRGSESYLSNKHMCFAPSRASTGISGIQFSSGKKKSMRHATGRYGRGEMRIQIHATIPHLCPVSSLKRGGLLVR